ncbi:MAG: hypothetical protein JSS72_07270 [Armatimonadetes bacterium]|nr:hypothetical protein [Armatimonadota bacterium]
MQALIFLSVRSILNGVKRAVTDAKRLIGLIFLIGYYIYLFGMRFIIGSPSSPGRFPAGSGRFHMPEPAQIQGTLFILFAGLSLIFSLMGSVRTLVRAPDVDVLFPTPVSPKTVLAFKMFREYLATLLLPLIFGLLSWRNTKNIVLSAFRDFPESGGMAFRALTIAFLLLSLFWVCTNQAISLFINRSDESSDRRRKAWIAFTIGAQVFNVAYIWFRIYSHAGFFEIANDPILRILFFPATLASSIVAGPLTSNMLLSYSCVVLLMGLTAFALWLAMAQSPWMYDQAATMSESVNTRRALQRQGDAASLIAEHVRSGKMKYRTERWYTRLRFNGPGGLIWKQLVLQIRTIGLMVGILSTVALFVGGLILYGMSTDNPEAVQAASGNIFFAVGMVGTFIITTTASQMTFMEVLRRVDLQKPLPFAPPTIIAYEIISNGILVLPLLTANFLAALVVNWQNWPAALGTLIAGPGTAIWLSSVIFLITILFPDLDDPTQRGFRGVMSLIALAVLAIPGAAAFGGALFLLRGSPYAILVAAAALGVIQLLMALAISIAGGGMYGSFNPSE